MVLQSRAQPEDDQYDEPQRSPSPAPQPQPQPQPMAQPKSAPAVPKELLSARPAMTRVVPRSPEKMRQANQTLEPPKPTQAELAERQERIDYLKSLRQTDAKPRRKKGGKKWLIILIVLLLLAGIAAGAYAFLGKKSKPGTTKTSSSAAQPQQAASTAPAQDTVPMKDYDSTNFALSLKYPTDWTVSDTAAKLTITSTPQKLTDASGKQITGQVIVTVRQKQTTLPEFKAGNAAAVLTSKRVSYSQPATGQRDSTYLSYLQYASTTQKGALDAIYVTGNSGYQKAQNVPEADIVKVDPLITVSFVACASSTTCASNSPAVSVEASSWGASALNKTVEDILKSLSIT